MGRMCNLAAWPSETLGLFLNPNETYHSTYSVSCLVSVATGLSSPFGMAVQPLLPNAVLVNKLVPCARLLSEYLYI